MRVPDLTAVPLSRLTVKFWFPGHSPAQVPKCAEVGTDSCPLQFPPRRQRTDTGMVSTNSAACRTGPGSRSIST